MQTGVVGGVDVGAIEQQDDDVADVVETRGHV